MTPPEASRPPVIETVRRWVWSGRLDARREGGHLLMARTDVEAFAARGGSAVISLARWAQSARTARDGAGDTRPGPTAADLVLEDRARRSGPAGNRGGR